MAVPRPEVVTPQEITHVSICDLYCVGCISIKQRLSGGHTQAAMSSTTLACWGEEGLLQVCSIRQVASSSMYACLDNGTHEKLNLCPP